MTSGLTKILSIILVLSVLGCSTKKRTVIEEKNLPKDIEGAMLKVIQNHNQSYKFLEGQFGFEMDSPEMSFSGTGTLRMWKDSIIWGTIKKLGFEVGRFKMTKDSIFLINRFEGKYFADKLNRNLIPALNDIKLSDLQDFIIGNATSFDTNQCQLSEQKPNTWTCQSNSIMYNLTFDSTVQSLQKTELHDARHDMDVTVDFIDYNQVNGNLESLNEFIQISDSQYNFQLKFLLENIKKDEPKEIKFQIPSHYEKM